MLLLLLHVDNVSEYSHVTLLRNENMADTNTAVDPNTQRKHHKKIEEYEERPKYRRGRRDKAVKVR